MEIYRPPWQKHPLIIVVSIFVLVGIAVIIAGYRFNWGFSTKTLWDWLQLLIIPIVLAIGGYLFNHSTSKSEQAVALANQHEVALQTYIDKMSELLLENKLRDSKPEDEVRKIARSRTLTVLHSLDQIRKRSVLQFLYESDLINKDMGGCIVSLDGANLKGINLSSITLCGADLSGANLDGIYSYGGDFGKAGLIRASLWKATLKGSNLNRADLHGATLYEVNLSNSDLSGADLSEAKLINVNLRESDLSGADLHGATLYEPKLRNTNLRGANLRGADLLCNNLNGADLQGAIRPDGSIHPGSMLRSV